MGRLQRLQFRLGDSNWFAGVQYEFLGADIRFNDFPDDDNVPDVEGADFETNSSALGVSLEYDSRNNYFTPTCGLSAAVQLDRYAKALGGDEDYFKGKAFAKGVGFRYLIARRFGLHAGIDVACGPEENAIYFQVGNAWAR